MSRADRAILIEATQSDSTADADAAIAGDTVQCLLPPSEQPSPMLLQASPQRSFTSGNGRPVYLIQFLQYVKTLGDFIASDPIGHAAYLLNLNASPKAILSNLVYDDKTDCIRA